MTRYYFWIGYNFETEEYNIAGAPCIRLDDVDGHFSLQLIRDSHFSKKIELGSRIKIHLVSIPSNGTPRQAQQAILNHLNTENHNNDVTIEKSIDILLPEKVNDFHSSEPLDSVRYDISNFDIGREFSNLKIIAGDFEITLNHHKPRSSDEEDYFFYSHPFIRM